MSEKPENWHDFLLRVLKGDVAAVDFCEVLFSISQIADDLYDRDHPVPPAKVEEVFWRCLVQLPNQPFYRQHFDVLQPLIQNAFVCWTTANALECGSQQDRQVAYVLRDELSGMVVHVAYLVGGYLYGREVAPVIRRFIHDEPIEKYLEVLQWPGGQSPAP